MWQREVNFLFWKTLGLWPYELLWHSIWSYRKTRNAINKEFIDFLNAQKGREKNHSKQLLFNSICHTRYSFLAMENSHWNPPPPIKNTKKTHAIKWFSPTPVQNLKLVLVRMCSVFLVVSKLIQKYPLSSMSCIF